jgi:hypothetical protein
MERADDGDEDSSFSLATDLPWPQTVPILAPGHSLPAQREIANTRDDGDIVHRALSRGPTSRSSLVAARKKTLISRPEGGFRSVSNADGNPGRTSRPAGGA